MTQAQLNLLWEPTALAKYNLMISKVPLFHRAIAKQVVDKKAPLLAQDRNSTTIEECDIIRAFFSEVPMAFYSLMIRLLDEVGFDYKRYEKN